LLEFVVNGQPQLGERFDVAPRMALIPLRATLEALRSLSLTPHSILFSKSEFGLGRAPRESVQLRQRVKLAGVVAQGEAC
jgi:hypothetical protein